MSRNCFSELQDIHSTPSTPPEHEQHHKASMEYCQSDYFSLRGVKQNQMFHRRVCFWLQRISPWGQSSEVMSKTGAFRHAGDDTNQASFHPPRHQYWHDGRESTFTYTGRIELLNWMPNPLQAFEERFRTRRRHKFGIPAGFCSLGEDSWAAALFLTCFGETLAVFPPIMSSEIIHVGSLFKRTKNNF